MTEEQLRALIREFLMENTDVDRNALADRFAETGDAETADVLRNGAFGYAFVALGDRSLASLLRQMRAGPKGVKAVGGVVTSFHTLGEQEAYARALAHLDFDTGCFHGPTDDFFEQLEALPCPGPEHPARGPEEELLPWRRRR
jgi:hypothetical protein